MQQRPAAGGLLRTASTPAQLHGGSSVSGGRGGSPAGGQSRSSCSCHTNRSTSGEGWQWFADTLPSKPGAWTSGFHRPSDERQPEKLGPADLFRWLAEVLRLSEEDVMGLEACRQLDQTLIVEQVYSRLLEFRGVRHHLRVGTEEQIMQRKHMLAKYLSWLLTLRHGSTDAYAEYLEAVAAVHQRGLNHVPPTLLLAGLAITQEAFWRQLCGTVKDKAQLQRSASALCKLLWMQAVFFVRHAQEAKQRPAHPTWRCLLVLLALLGCRRALPRWLGTGRRAAALLDLVVAGTGALLLSASWRWLPALGPEPGRPQGLVGSSACAACRSP